MMTSTPADGRVRAGTRPQAAPASQDRLVFTGASYRARTRARTDLESVGDRPESGATRSTVSRFNPADMVVGQRSPPGQASTAEPACLPLCSDPGTNAHHEPSGLLLARQVCL